MAQNIKIAPFGEARVVGVREIDNTKPEEILQYDTVLVKFSFTNRAHIPAGIPEQKRLDDSTVDNRHAHEALAMGHTERAQIGRVREGRVDTGTQFIHNLQFVQPGCLVRGLSNVGYTVSQCHWFFKKGFGKSSDKYVVVLALSLGGEPVNLPNQAIEQRRALANTCWQWCHGWSNLDGTLTLNFGGRLPDGKPQHSVVVRNRQLSGARITSLVTEEDETKEIE